MPMQAESLYMEKTGTIFLRSISRSLLRAFLPMKGIRIGEMMVGVICIRASPYLSVCYLQ